MSELTIKPHEAGPKMKLPQEFDLHALEVFIMTVELGGMSQCALHLQVTQSAVSQTVARLEATIGTPLFDRSMRPLGLTTNGRSMFERGKRLLTQARSTYDEVRAGANLPLASLTIAMSFSLANQLTAPILSSLGSRAERWNIRSGISLEHQGEFIARDIDMLITGSFNLEHRDNVELHPVFEECFVVAVPADYRRPVQMDTAAAELPLSKWNPRISSLPWWQRDWAGRSHHRFVFWLRPNFCARHGSSRCRVGASPAQCR